MIKTRQIIIDNKDEFPEFGYYHDLVDKIEDNIDKMPDIAIECCKSLFEGVSKTILKKLKISYKDTDKGRDNDTPRSLLKKVLSNIPNIGYHDPEFVTRTCELIDRIGNIRNERGDISHGRSSPKEISSDSNLAEFISHVTDSTIYYLLKIYFGADLSYLEEIKYDDNDEFNQFLDSGYELAGVLYSKALFDQDAISYEEQLNNYLSSKEEGNL